MVAVIAGVALLAGGFTAGWAVSNSADDSGDDTAAAAVAPAVSVESDTDDRPGDAPLDTSGEEPVAAVADAVAPTVVQIETTTGLGSGVIYDPDGLVLTAAHVVEGSDTVTLRLADGTSRDGTVLGTDTDSDIGVVAIDGGGADLPVAVLADEAPDVGDLAVAVGSPFALDQTVTSGIVSALDRPGPRRRPVGRHDPDRRPDQPGQLGRSAGQPGRRDHRHRQLHPEPDRRQHRPRASPSPSTSPSGWPTPWSPGSRSSSATSASRAATPPVARRVPSSAPWSPARPAEDAGLQSGDLVIGLNGDAVTSFGDLGVIIRRHVPGDELELTVSRDGDEQQLTATLGSTVD